MKPLNRFIMVQRASKKEKKQNGFYLPDDVIVEKKSHEVVKVLKVSSDSKFAGTIKPGDSVVAESHLIIPVEIDEETLFFVLENNILALC